MKHLFSSTRFIAVFSAACTAALLGALLAAGDAASQTLPPPPLSPAPVIGLEYDAQGNPVRQTLAPGTPGFSTSHQHDRLGRRSQTTDARGGTIRFDYNGREDLVQVTDPRGLVTRYPRNGLGDALSLISPDTGTATHTYDAAGNLLSRTDARGVLATYTYDALNRLRGVTYGGGGSLSWSYGWTYDQTGPAFGAAIGRLTSTSYPSGTTTYGYDTRGRILRSAQTVTAGIGFGNGFSPVTLGTAYGYDAAGRVLSITYPSGRVLRFARAGGQVSAISLAGDAAATPQMLLSGILSDPAPGDEGAVRSWQWQMNGSTQAHERVFDNYGRMVRYPLGGAVRDVLYDAADRIVAYRHLDASSGTATAAAQSLDQSFGYDELGRLTSVGTSMGQWVLAYDANGNRTSVSHTAGGATQTRQYQVSPTSNRLLGLNNPWRTMQDDAAGSRNADYTWGPATSWDAWLDASGRVWAYDIYYSDLPYYTQAIYGYNANGQRMFKTLEYGIVNPRVVFVYDLEGNMLGEYDATSGAVLREYVWLQGMPVAFVDGPPTAPRVYYVYTDHLNAPRVVIDQAGNQRWSWVAEPFGNSAPITSPTGLAPVELNLRFPGQYFDAETGLIYNHHRDYDASVGRYIQSDPIGLAGGINTYAYVSGQPTRYTDRFGLWETAGHDYFIDKQFAALPPAIRDIIKEGSAYADRNEFQGPDYSFMHAMSSKSMSPDEARREMCKFIRRYMAEANDAKHEGSGRYWFFLGMALHPVMDSTSPAHEGFQMWRGVRRDGHRHGPSPWSIETKEIAMQPYHTERTLRRMREAMNGNLGECGC